MSAFTTRDGATVNYQEYGSGPPILLLHGCWMSSRFFEPAIARLQTSFRVVAVDFRGHGASEKTLHGHTVTRYAQDIEGLCADLGLTDLLLLGWSMGAFVGWEMILRGEVAVAGMVVVDQSASDFRTPDWPLAFADLPVLIDLVRAVQEDFAGVVEGLVPEMFAVGRSADELAWMRDELVKVPPAIASTILVDQTLRDYRPQLKRISVPTLVCFGRDEKIMPVELGRLLAAGLPDAQLEVFGGSSHCPFYEEPDAFVAAVTAFASRSARTERLEIEG